jgi:hypothetical protein
MALRDLSFLINIVQEALTGWVALLMLRKSAEEVNPLIHFKIAVVPPHWLSTICKAELGLRRVCELFLFDQYIKVIYSVGL